jgi:large-conductance mechanosensitive channel
MGIASIVVGVLIVAFVALIVISQIRTETRTRQRQEKKPDRQGRQEELSHEKAKTREWWV